MFVIIFSFTQQHSFSTLDTSTLLEANYKTYSITHEIDFFAYIFCGKIIKNTFSKLPAQKMVNTLPSSVARWRSKKDIQENPKACETFAFVRFQFPWHYHRSYCFPKRLPFFAGFFWPVILCNPRPNRKCFGVNNSSFLTPWIKSDAYVSINLIFFCRNCVFSVL